MYEPNMLHVCTAKGTCGNSDHFIYALLLLDVPHVACMFFPKRKGRSRVQSAAILLICVTSSFANDPSLCDQSIPLRPHCSSGTSLFICDLAVHS